MFLELAPKDVDCIILASDAAELRSQSHRLKGSALALGLPRLANTCGELEKLGAGGDLAAAAPVLTRLIVEFEATRAALAEELERAAPPTPAAVVG